MKYELRQKISDLADGYAQVWIIENTKIEMDSPKYRSLVNAFADLGNDVVEEVYKMMSEILGEQK